MISFLVTVLFLLIILYVVKLVLNSIELPANVKQIIWILIGVLVLFMALQWFGLYDAGIKLPK
jgi:hypothetical protein